MVLWLMKIVQFQYCRLQKIERNSESEAILFLSKFQNIIHFITILHIRESMNSNITSLNSHCSMVHRHLVSFRINC